MKRNHLNLLLVTLLVLVTGLVAMPQSAKQSIPDVPAIWWEEGDWLPSVGMSDSFRNYLLTKDIRYGLDLAGGSQLDFVIDLTRVRKKIAEGEDITEADVVNGVKATLQRRIDPDGTRELNIYTADFGEEKHVFVELTADLDNAETRAKLERHIDLQFMEPKNETDEAELEATRLAAENALGQISGGEDFAAVATALEAEMAEVDATTQKYRVLNLAEQQKYRDQLAEEVATAIWDAEPGTVIAEVIETDGGYTYDMNSGQFRPSQRFSIFQVGEKEVTTRIKTELGEDFTAVADEVSLAETVEKPIDDIGEETKVDILTNIQPNQVSEIYELDGAFAFFKLLPANEEVTSARVAEVRTATREEAEAALERVSEQTIESEEAQLTYNELAFDVTPNPWRPSGLDGQNFRIAKVSTNPTNGMPIVLIEFDDEGAQKFEDLTEKLVGQPMAIFVGGAFISSPIIQEKISGGTAQITLGAANYYEAQGEAISLANDLNAGAIPAPITLDGELRIAPTFGMKALEQSIIAALVGLSLLALWMIYSYRLLGIYAVVALAIYATMIIFILKMIPIFVLTLAGVAGLILSIGMAVDANVLIFERMREELRNEKNYSAALAIGFDRAWTSIRDSNITTLLVCGILFLFGTSIVKGFATMLAIGVILSMFTAITITRTLLKTLIGTNVSRSKTFLTKL